MVLSPGACRQTRTTEGGYRDVVIPSALARGVGVILSGIAGFLSNLFLILMMMLFLLAEGPVMMDRLRASAVGTSLASSG